MIVERKYTCTYNVIDRKMYVFAIENIVLSDGSSDSFYN